jgi:hypothetical protein
MTSRPNLRPLLAGLLLTALSAAPSRAADRALEHAVKATFLFKFAAFVEWPAGSFESETSPFRLCVVGMDPYGGKIEEAVRGQRVGRHPILLRRLSAADGRSGCHAMFLSGSAAQSVDRGLDAISGSPVLTVTDSALAGSAGIIHFVIVDDRVSFDIDLAAARRARLDISSKLLALARRVRTGAGP